MKKLTRISAAVLVAVPAVFAPMALAQTNTPNPNLTGATQTPTANPVMTVTSNITVGKPFTISGSGFSANEHLAFV